MHKVRIAVLMVVSMFLLATNRFPPGEYQAPLPKTGQVTSYATSDDGDLIKGIAWPNPRFTDNGDGTVTDNLTGLIWLKDTNCFGMCSISEGLNDCYRLSEGQCGLTDGSSAGDWRLPNSNELASLVHKGYYNPAVSNTTGTGQWSEGDLFNNVQSYSYWSSPTDASTTVSAWGVNVYSGRMYDFSKTSYGYIWPVRGGH